LFADFFGYALQELYAFGEVFELLFCDPVAENVSGGVVLELLMERGYITLQNVIDIIKVIAGLLLWK
jgi:hypothetical protein